MARRKKNESETPGYAVERGTGPDESRFTVTREADGRMLGVYAVMEDVERVIAADRERAQAEESAGSE